MFGDLIGLDLPHTSRPSKVSTRMVLKANEKATLAELKGPGCIRCLLIVMHRREKNQGRKQVLRIYWDGEESPSIESPVTDLFGVCNGEFYYPINSIFLSVKHQDAYTCYLPMPFARSARIELEAGPAGGGVTLQVEWDRYREPMKEEMRFHAKWRREFPAPAFGKEYLVLDAVGRGVFMGFAYGLRQHDLSENWAHGGADEFYFDGDTEYPAFVHGNGGEDTFGTGFGAVVHDPESHLFSGIPLWTYEDRGDPYPVINMGAYRFYPNEHFAFSKSLQLRFGCLANDICSTAYWYQTEPHRDFFRMPSWDKMLPGVELRSEECDIPAQDSGQWWLCGAFPLSDMTRTLPPEIGFDPQAVYDVQWETGSAWTKDVAPDHPQTKAHWMLCNDIHGFVDFSHAFRPRALGVWRAWDGVACATTWLTVSEDSDASLTFTWDDDLVYSLNDAEPISLGRHEEFDTEEVTVHLQKGANRLCVKQSNTFGKNWGGWCFALLARLRDGTVLKPGAPGA